MCSCNFSESSQVLAIQIVNKKEYPPPHFTKRYRLVGKLWVCGFSSSSKHSVLTDSPSSTTEDPQTDTAPPSLRPSICPGAGCSDRTCRLPGLQKEQMRESHLKCSGCGPRMLRLGKRRRLLFLSLLLSFTLQSRPVLFPAFCPVFVIRVTGSERHPTGSAVAASSRQCGPTAATASCVGDTPCPPHPGHRKHLSKYTEEQILNIQIKRQCLHGAGSKFFLNADKE